DDARLHADLHVEGLHVHGLRLQPHRRRSAAVLLRAGVRPVHGEPRRPDVEVRGHVHVQPREVADSTRTAGPAGPAFSFVGPRNRHRGVIRGAWCDTHRSQHGRRVVAYDYKLLNVEIEGRIAWVTVNAPPINVITLPLYAEIAALSLELKADPNLTVVV